MMNVYQVEYLDGRTLAIVGSLKRAVQIANEYTGQDYALTRAKLHIKACGFVTIYRDAENRAGDYASIVLWKV